jgi:hypothetical protein
VATLKGNIEGLTGKNRDITTLNVFIRAPILLAYWNITGYKII